MSVLFILSFISDRAVLTYKISASHRLLIFKSYFFFVM